MEQSIKRKVNRIGLAGQIVSIVLIVLTAVGCAALLALGIGLSVLPKDAVNVGVSADMDITVGKGLLGKYMDEQAYWDLDCKSPAFITVRKLVSVIYATEPVLFCYGSQSRLMHRGCSP